MSGGERLGPTPSGEEVGHGEVRGGGGPVDLPRGLGGRRRKCRTGRPFSPLIPGAEGTICRHCKGRRDLPLRHRRAGFPGPELRLLRTTVLCSSPPGAVERPGQATLRRGARVGTRAQRDRHAGRTQTRCREGPGRGVCLSAGRGDTQGLMCKHTEGSAVPFSLLQQHPPPQPVPCPFLHRMGAHIPTTREDRPGQTGKCRTPATPQARGSPCTHQAGPRDHTGASGVVLCLKRASLTRDPGLQE